MSCFLSHWTDPAWPDVIGMVQEIHILNHHPWTSLGARCPEVLDFVVPQKTQPSPNWAVRISRRVVDLLHICIYRKQMETIPYPLYTFIICLSHSPCWKFPKKNNQQSTTCSRKWGYPMPSLGMGIALVREEPCDPSCRMFLVAGNKTAIHHE